MKRRARAVEDSKVKPFAGHRVLLRVRGIDGHPFPESQPGDAERLKGSGIQLIRESALVKGIEPALPGKNCNPRLPCDASRAHEVGQKASGSLGAPARIDETAGSLLRQILFGAHEPVPVMHPRLMKPERLHHPVTIQEVPLAKAPAVEEAGTISV